MNTAYIVPAADLLPYWPHDLLAPTDVPVIGPLSQRVGVTAFEIDDWDGFLTVTGTLAVWEELELKLPLVDGLSLARTHRGRPSPRSRSSCASGTRSRRATREASSRAPSPFFLRATCPRTSWSFPSRTGRSSPRASGRAARSQPG
jgi:hypothetical protein